MIKWLVSVGDAIFTWLSTPKVHAALPWVIGFLVGCLTVEIINLCTGRTVLFRIETEGKDNGNEKSDMRGV